MATAIMKQKGFPEMDDVEEIISKISEESPYKRRPTQKRTWMTVPEMGKLLGLKKTDRYWLVHKNVFESKEIAGKIRINIASFEKWYANQIKYHKVTGEEPGKELKSWSYSVKEVADLLGVDEYLVYDLLKKNQMEAVIVDYWKRIPKESFQNWYKSQSRYRTREDREKDALLEDATITMPEMAQLLGITRSSVYTMKANLREIIHYIDESTLEKVKNEKVQKQEFPSKVSKDIEEAVDKIIANRMSKAYSEWKSNQDTRPYNENIEKEYQKLLETLSPEQEEVLTKYCDEIFASGAETEEFFYRLGIKDGLRLKSTVKSVLEMMAQNRNLWRDFLNFPYFTGFSAH